MKKTILAQTPWDNEPILQTQIAKTRNPQDGAIYDEATRAKPAVQAGRPVQWNADYDNGAGPIPNAGLADNKRPLPLVDGYRPRRLRVVR